ncbi:hypothetical protein ACFX15_023904 [Malus domestica]
MLAQELLDVGFPMLERMIQYVVVPCRGKDDKMALYHATPIQQIPPSHHHHHSMVLESTMDSSNTINFSYSAATSFMSSLTGDSDSKQLMSSSAFQITNFSQVSSAEKSPLSSTSLKRKCISENLGSGKYGAGSSGRCHCSKKRKLRQKRVVRVPAISLKMADEAAEHAVACRTTGCCISMLHCSCCRRDMLQRQRSPSDTLLAARNDLRCDGGGAAGMLRWCSPASSERRVLAMAWQS